MRALVLVVALAVAGVMARGNVEAGKQKAAQVCAACHGPEGNKPSDPTQPILAGQYYDYLVRAITDYKNGRRNNPIMKGFAAQLPSRTSKTWRRGSQPEVQPARAAQGLDPKGVGTLFPIKGRIWSAIPADERKDRKTRSPAPLQKRV